MFIILSGDAINEMCSKEIKDSGDSITNQKSGLKIAILNLLKMNGKYLIGYYLIKNDERRSKQVTDFLQVIFS